MQCRFVADSRRSGDDAGSEDDAGRAESAGWDVIAIREERREYCTVTEESREGGRVGKVGKKRSGWNKEVECSDRAHSRHVGCRRGWHAFCAAQRGDPGRTHDVVHAAAGAFTPRRRAHREARR